MRWFCLPLVFMIVCFWSGAVLAEKRMALVIGIDRYDNLAPDKQLRKAVNDARAIAAALRGLGFDTEEGENVTRREFYRLWSRFAATLSPGDVAAVFFSGHGVDLDGVHLIPGDVQAHLDETGLKADAIPLRDLVADLRRKRLQVSFEIIDACRDNPFADPRGRSFGVARGLTRPDNPEGNFIMYSAGEQQQALDRLSEYDADLNSVYTRALLPLLRRDTGLSLDEIAKKVRSRVREMARTVGHTQFPAYYNELTEDFYLGEKPAASLPPRPGEAAAAQAWDRIKNSEDSKDFELFIKHFGESDPFYAELARKRLSALRASQQTQPTKPDIENFVQTVHLRGQSVYSDPIDFFDKGIISKTDALQERRKYREKWPVQDYDLVPSSLEVKSYGHNTYIVSFQYKFHLSNSSKSISGKGQSVLIVKLEDSIYTIESIKDGVPKK